MESKSYSFLKGINVSLNNNKITRIELKWGDG
jgi:hypothetical protein